MARRRRWGTGSRLAYGLSSGLSSALQLMMRDLLAERSSERTGKLQEERDMRVLDRQGKIQQGAQEFQARQSAFGELPELVDTLGPDAALSTLAARGVELFPPTTPRDEVGTGEYGREQAAGQARTRDYVQGLRPPMRRKLEGTVGKAITDADAPEELDTNAILGQLLAADDRVEPPQDEPGMRVGGLRPEAYEYITRAEDKAQALRSKPTQRVEGTDAQGRSTVQMLSPFDMMQPVPTSPTAQEQGTLAGQQEVAKGTAELDPAFQELKTRTLARMQNITEALTRQAKIATAAGIAGATKRAELAPDIVSAEVARARAISNQPGQSTESERRAAANWTPLVNAHANALMQETQGSTLTPGAVEITGSSWLNPLLGGMVDPNAARYAQSARDFVTTLGYIRSGVQVRADEVDKFLATMFAFEGDAPAQVQQKQQAREILLGAMQAMVGRSAPEAARVLSAAINAGQISPSILTSIEIRPEIAREMLPLLQGVPQFNADGTPKTVTLRPR